MINDGLSKPYFYRSRSNLFSALKSWEIKPGGSFLSVCASDYAASKFLGLLLIILP